MTAVWRDALGRVWRAPMVLISAWAITTAFCVPLALSVRAEITRHLGNSLEAAGAAEGVNFDWMQEFTGQATELGATVGPSLIGFAAVLDNVSGMLDGVARPAAVVGAIAGYLIVWLFCAGGVIDRLARDRPTRAHGFFAACGGYFFRLARLALIAAVIYGFLFNATRPWLLEELYASLTYDTTVERNAFLVRLTLYVVFALFVAAANVVLDYAKVRIVIEDRRSALGAVGAALRFIVRRPVRALGAYGLNVLLLAAVLGGYALVAPGAAANMWLAFAAGQLYVIGRLWVKLAFWASEAAVFQAELAHAGYVARRLPVWPESPAAEAITGGALVSGTSRP